MSRIHDMGGRFGDGPVAPDFGKDPVFKTAWHGRAFGLTLASGFLGQWTLDEGRHARECLSPVVYSGFSYYEKWLAGLANMLVAKGIVTRNEFETLTPLETQQDLKERRLRPENVLSALSKGGPTERDAGPKPAFSVGQDVMTRHAANLSIDGGHTRLPNYAAGKQGTIVAQHGNYVFPDANAHQAGEAPEPLYTVAFCAETLWQHPENPDDLIMLDLWQSYLSPAL